MNSSAKIQVYEDLVMNNETQEQRDKQKYFRQKTLEELRFFKDPTNGRRHAQNVQHPTNQSIETYKQRMKSDFREFRQMKAANNEQLEQSLRL